MRIFREADILIPKKGTDFSKWSVVACDQYTSELEYWERVKSVVGSAPSALNIIFPEVYLEESGAEKRIESINDTMYQYLGNGIFDEFKDSYIYVERTQSDGRVRHGIVGAVDLEAYDFSEGSVSPVRATEGTILERIPPRKRVRENAPLELPHIMLLADDKKNMLFSIFSEKKDMPCVYDFDLMEKSGHIRGYLVQGKIKQKLTESIDNFLSDNNNEGSLVFAVGDGNHSLATAKACWEEIKKTLTKEEIKTHPSRYALAELVNLYDDALTFEAIHRVMFDVNPETVLNALLRYYPDASFDDNGGQKIEYVYGTARGEIFIKNGQSNLAVGNLQKFIDDYIKENGGRVDYIHGENVVKQLSGKCGRIGFIVEPMQKTELYTTVIKDGSLPRKTFSMGEAEDKRFYLEAKRIK